MSGRSTQSDNRSRLNSSIKNDSPFTKRIYNEASAELFKKKLLKGKLIKLINESLIQSKVDWTQGMNQNDFLEIRTEKIDRRNFSVNAFPSIIGRDIKYSSLRQDKYVTPQELLFSNFDKSEIQLISSNPLYFKIPENFKKIEQFKKRRLIEVLENEEFSEPPPKMKKVILVPRCYNINKSKLN